MTKAQEGSGSREVAAAVQKIIAAQLKMKPAEIRMEAQLQNDLGVASLDAMEIVLSIEEAFGIDIPDEEARKAKTPGDIANFVSRKLQRPSEP